jgi:hypothetical protein
VGSGFKRASHPNESEIAPPGAPTCHRRIVELILTLPAEYRQRGGLPWDLIASRWPQLLQVPFNEPIGLRAGLRIARRATRSALRRFFPPPHPVTVPASRDAGGGE